MKQFHIASIDRSSQDYCYDELRVVRGEDGILYYAEDSGCSCPIPFEHANNDFPASWTPIKHGDSWESFKRHVQSWAKDSYYLKADQISQFIEDVRKQCLN